MDTHYQARDLRAQCQAGAAEGRGLLTTAIKTQTHGGGGGVDSYTAPLAHCSAPVRTPRR